MSLRLDPKYHGVRVARVRPRIQYIVERRVVNHEQWGKVRFSDGCLIVKNSRRGYWVLTGVALRSNFYAGQKEALEALGLR